MSASTDCDRIKLLFDTNHTCCNSSSAWLTIDCDSYNRITGILYDNAPFGRHCALNSTSLANLTALESLTLDNYVDETFCPEFAKAFQHLRLGYLAMRGANISDTTVVQVNADTLSKLDLSFSNLTTIPSWIDNLGHLKTLLIRGSELLKSPSPSFMCNVSRMALNLRTEDLDWINTNCTHLTSLDLQLNVRPDALDLSYLTRLEFLSVSTNQAYQSKFPFWLGNLTQLQTLTYHARIVDTLPPHVLRNLPLVVLDLTGNDLMGELPHELSATQLDIVRLRDNMLWGTIPAGLANASLCDLGNNPILCAGIGNAWSLCHHCGLVPSFLELMSKYKIQLIAIAVCLMCLLFGWIWVVLCRKHQRPSFWTFINVFYSLFGIVNLLTTIVHLGLIGHRYVSLTILCVTTAISLGLNAYMYRYCCRRFNILVIRRTWPVFVLCTLDLNNFRLYEIPMLNLSAYRTSVDFRIPVALSLLKVLLADIPHTTVAIYLLMLHSPVASTLLMCITSGIGIVRGFVQFCCLSCQARRQAKANRMLSSTEPPIPHSPKGRKDTENDTLMNN